MKNFLTLNFLISLNLISSIFSELLDYSEKDWPSSCKGRRNSPINFPYNYIYDTSNYFEILSTQYNAISGLRFEEVDKKKYHIVNLNNNYYGYLLARKNGITYKYNLIDVHFHVLSEHTFNGKSSDFELHMVHQKDLQYLKDNNITDTDEDKVNKYLVVGTLFDAEGDEDNENFNKFKIGKNEAMQGVNMQIYSNPDLPYYYYIGGLTTPACDEVVNWVVNSIPVKVSKRQNTEMRNWVTKLYPDGNARKVQFLNGRTIYKVDKKGLDKSSGYLNLNILNFLIFGFVCFILF